MATHKGTSLASIGISNVGMSKYQSGVTKRALGYSSGLGRDVYGGIGIATKTDRTVISPSTVGSAVRTLTHGHERDKGPIPTGGSQDQGSDHVSSCTLQVHRSSHPCSQIQPDPNPGSADRSYDYSSSSSTSPIISSWQWRESRTSSCHDFQL